MCSQANLLGLIPRTRREKLSEGKVFARPSSLSTGPQKNRCAAITAFPACYVRKRITFLNRKFVCLILRRNITHNVYGHTYSLDILVTRRGRLLQPNDPSGAIPVNWTSLALSAIVKLVPSHLLTIEISFPDNNMTRSGGFVQVGVWLPS